VRPEKTSDQTLGTYPVLNRGGHRRLALLGTILIALGFLVYVFAIVLSLTRLAVFQNPHSVQLVADLLWYSGMPTSLGVILVAVDLLIFLPRKRYQERRIEECEPTPQKVAVALMSYNDEASIGLAVRDFIAHPMVAMVIVVDNNSQDRSAAVAADAGAVVVTESRPGYGFCMYRCLQELHERGGTDFVALCEGDMTFRARDLEKLASFAPHADIINGTRIVEQLRAYQTQLSTFMYYGNFFVGKLLEIKHIGKGTFTDVGTTYKLLRRGILPQLLPELDPSINLEFNPYFLDRALSLGYLVVECPITFHRRVGMSKGGNVNNMRAFKVGTRMILGLLTDWRLPRP
jgi:glycosyl transferase family 2